MPDIQLLHGNCLDILPTLPDCSVDSIVTDPPYELGFMGKKWDNSGIAYNHDLWQECLRVLKPGGHLLAFGGTRTYHRMAVAIEDAGFEIRDSLHWIYGSGFPKSLDVSKAIDKTNGEPDRLLKFTLWFRDAGLAVKEVTRILKTAGLISENGTMASHYFAKSRDGQPAIPTSAMWEVIRPHISEVPGWVDELVARIEAEREVIGNDTKARSTAGKSALPTVGGETIYETWDITAPATDAAKEWSGWGTALKPAHEPIVVARKPLVGTVAGNVLQWGTGAINIDGTRVAGEPWKSVAPNAGGRSGGVMGKHTEHPGGEAHPAGRWPANIVFTHNHDCADVCTEGCPVRELDQQSGTSKSQGGRIGKKEHGAVAVGGAGTFSKGDPGFGDTGGASRFFTVTEWDAPFRYVAKPGKRERNAGLNHLPEKVSNEKTPPGTLGSNSPRAGANRSGASQNHHPTVKPLTLMRWLVRLVTPPNGTVLEPFAGSGTTLVACHLEGFNAIGIEMTDEYLPIIKGRLEWARQQPAEPDNAQQELEL